MNNIPNENGKVLEKMLGFQFRCFENNIERPTLFQNDLPLLKLTGKPLPISLLLCQRVLIAQ